MSAFVPTLGGGLIRARCVDILRNTARSKQRHSGCGIHLKKHSALKAAPFRMWHQGFVCHPTFVKIVRQLWGGRTQRAQSSDIPDVASGVGLPSHIRRLCSFIVGDVETLSLSDLNIRMSETVSPHVRNVSFLKIRLSRQSVRHLGVNGPPLIS